MIIEDRNSVSSRDFFFSEQIYWFFKKPITWKTRMSPPSWFTQVTQVPPALACSACQHSQLYPQTSLSVAHCTLAEGTLLYSPWISKPEGKRPLFVGTWILEDFDWLVGVYDSSWTNHCALGDEVIGLVYLKTHPDSWPAFKEWWLGTVWTNWRSIAKKINLPFLAKQIEKKNSRMINFPLVLSTTSQGRTLPL